MWDFYQQGDRLLFAPPQRLGSGAVVTLRLQRGTAFSSSFLLPTDAVRPGKGDSASIQHSPEGK